MNVTDDISSYIKWRYYNFQIILIIYRLYYILQQRSHEHFNLMLLLSCGFNKFGNFSKSQG